MANMERQHREFLKVIRKNLIYLFLFFFIIVCLALSPERGAAQFFPFGPALGAPIGGFGALPALGGLAPLGLPALPIAAAPYSLPAPAPIPLPAYAGASPYLSGPSLLPVSSPYLSPAGGAGSVPVNYGQPAYYAQPAYAQSTYGQPAYAQPAYAQPTYGTTAPLNYAATGYPYGTAVPAGYMIDPRYAQSYTGTPYTTGSPTSTQQPVYYPQNPLYYNPVPATTSQQSSTTKPATQTSSTKSSDDTTPIQDLPNLTALWQGTYTLYDPQSDSLTVLKEGQVTLGLTQNKNAYQINGYMTANNWEIVDENKKGRVLATATYNGSQIDFISVIVKFYPDLPNDQEPTSDSVMYMWVFSGSIINNTLQGSLNISGPDNYTRAGTINLARKQI